MKLTARVTGLLLACQASLVAAATDLVIATVDNGHMIEMERLGRQFEQTHPAIRLRWVTLGESVLRQRVTDDVIGRGGRFDVMTIGMYETPIWAKQGWLVPIRTDADYDVDDLLPAIRNGLSFGGQLYAAPIYGESSMLMYRKDLADRAGIQFPERPSWTEVREAAARLHDPARGVYGICLRGKPGWGDNMALVTTMANAFGGQWFDSRWRPLLDSPPWHAAVHLYVDLLRRFGPPGSTSNGFKESLALFAEGKCALWVDATIAAATLTDPRQSKVADRVAFAQAPRELTDRGANWLWAWALAIPASSRQPEAAQTFIRWATSRDYIRRVARDQGWAAVPTGTRKSTYRDPDFVRSAGFARAELAAIETADPNHATLQPAPYSGIQFAAIPEFQTIGNQVGAHIGAALAGAVTVEQALALSAQDADRALRKAGYQ